MGYRAQYRTDWTRYSWHLPAWRDRKDWDRDRIAGAKYHPTSVRPWLRNCEGCRFLIGPDYWQREVFVEPWLDKTTVRWRCVCGQCAIETGLGRGYCLVSESDYRAGYPAVFGGVNTARERKIGQAKGQLIRSWARFAADREAAYLALRGRWTGAGDGERARLFEAAYPEWSAYLRWYYNVVRLRDWYRRFDRDGQGCPKRHNRPSECARSYHRALFPLSALALFMAFRAQYEPEQWTIGNHLSEREGAVA